MKPEELAVLTKKDWIIRFDDMNQRQLAAEIARRKGGMFYQLDNGTYLLGRDYGEYFVPGCRKIEWPDPLPADYFYDTDSFPDWSANNSAAIQLGAELKATFGDPHILSMETDPSGHRRWKAFFRKSTAYAWGDTPAEAMCRAYLLAFEIHTP